MITKRRINGKSGVTLIELIVTVVIISVVCVAATAGISYAKRVSYVNNVREQLTTISNGISEIILTELRDVDFGDNITENNSKVVNVVPTINSYLENNRLGVKNITYENQDFVEVEDDDPTTEYDYQFICDFNKSVSTPEGEVFYTVVTVRLLNRFSAKGELIKSDKYRVTLEQTFYIPEPAQERADDGQTGE